MEKIKPTIVTKQEDFSRALDREDMVIYVESPLYGEILKATKKALNGRVINAGAGWAALIGLIFGGPIGWGLFIAGAIGGITGNAMDSLKKYNVEIVEVQSRIVLLKAKGKNKFKKRKHEIMVV